MRARALLAVLIGCGPAAAGAQAIVTSSAPDKVAVTVYRSPCERCQMELQWLNGFAMVRETRHVSLPAGESELRFEGVAGGIVPQSAIVEGLGDVVEKNRDAKLLSPGTLLDSLLGRRLHLRRTSQATGVVREQEAVVRASGDGVVLETAEGIEALRCTGLSETPLANSVPPTLSAKPTLSVRLRAERPVQGTVTLTYLSTGFDWRAHYVATVAPSGDRMSLFAWLTLANGDETGFANAQTMAVAGRLNREHVDIVAPEVRPITLTCWPAQRTHEIPLENSLGRYAPPPPPPPPAAPERGSPVSVLDAQEIVLTGSRIMAQREALGDLKLYRIPISVTVASRSQKQVALLEQPAARFSSVYRWRSYYGNRQDEPVAASRVLKMENRTDTGLGLPLPAGSFTLFTQRNGRPFLLGEGTMTDRAVGEKVEVEIEGTPGVTVTQRQLERSRERAETELVVTNDQSSAIRFEGRFSEERGPLSSSEKLARRDGAYWWTVSVPANSSRTLRIRYRVD
jgi:hypothetical protein